MQVPTKCFVITRYLINFILIYYLMVGYLNSICQGGVNIKVKSTLGTSQIFIRISTSRILIITLWFLYMYHLIIYSFSAAALSPKISNLLSFQIVSLALFSIGHGESKIIPTVSNLRKCYHCPQHRRWRHKRHYSSYSPWLLRVRASGIYRTRTHLSKY